MSTAEANSKFEQYKAAVKGAELTNREARAVAKNIAGTDIKWDWDLPRTKEGYYHFRGGVPVRPLHASRLHEQSADMAVIAFGNSSGGNEENAGVRAQGGSTLR